MKKKKKKFILIIVSAVLLIFVFFSLIYLAIENSLKPQISTDKTIIIDNVNKYNKDIDKVIFVSASTASYNTVLLNIKDAKKNYHGTIRTDSFKNEAGKYVSFILDIPSIEMSWSIWQAVDKANRPVSDISVNCVPKEQIIYKSSNNCNDNSNNLTDKQTDQIKIAKILPLYGPTYDVTSRVTSDGDNYILTITYYSEKGKQDAIDAIKILGYNPDLYELIFIDGLK
jgi:hypothetical protein